MSGMKKHPSPAGGGGGAASGVGAVGTVGGAIRTGGGDGKDVEVRRFVQSLRGEMAAFAQNYPKPGATTPPKMPATLMAAASAVGSTTPAGSLPTSPTSTLVETLSHTLTGHTGSAYSALPPPAAGAASSAPTGSTPILPTSTLVTSTTPKLTGIGSPPLSAGVALSPAAGPDQSPPATPLSPPDSVPSATTPRRAISNPDLVEPDSAPARSQPNSPSLTKAGSSHGPSSTRHHHIPVTAVHPNGIPHHNLNAVNEPATPNRDRERNERDEQNVNALLQSPKTPTPSSRANPAANYKAKSSKSAIDELDDPLLRVDEHPQPTVSAAAASSVVGSGSKHQRNSSSDRRVGGAVASVSSGNGNGSANGSANSNSNSSNSEQPLLQVHNATNNRSIYLAGLPQETILSDLCDLIIQSGIRGAIESLKLVTERGLGYISFVDPSPATHFMENALLSAAANNTGPTISSAAAGGASPSFGALPAGQSAAVQAAAAAQQPPLSMQINSGLTIRGKRIRVGWGTPVPLDPQTAAAIIQGGATRTVFLGGLDTSASEVSLHTQFTQSYGLIEKLDVLHHKRIAFVHFASITSAVNCVSTLQQQQIVALAAANEHKSHHHRKSILRANFGPDRCAGPVPPKSFSNPPPSQAILTAVATGGVAAAVAVSQAQQAAASNTNTRGNSQPSPMSSPPFQPLSSPGDSHSHSNIPLLPPSNGSSYDRKSQPQPIPTAGGGGFGAKRPFMRSQPQSMQSGQQQQQSMRQSGFRQYQTQQQQPSYQPQYQQQSQYYGQQQQPQQQPQQSLLQSANQRAGSYRPAPALAHPRENQHHPFHPQFQHQRMHQQQQHQQHHQASAQHHQQQTSHQPQQQTSHHQPQAPSPQQSPPQLYHQIQVQAVQPQSPLYQAQQPSVSPLTVSNASGVSGGSTAGGSGAADGHAHSQSPLAFDQTQYEQDQRDEQEDLLRDQQEAANGAASPQFADRHTKSPSGGSGATPQQRAMRQYRLYQANQIINHQQQQIYMQQQLFMQAQMQQQLFLQQQQAVFQQQQAAMQYQSGAASGTGAGAGQTQSTGQQTQSAQSQKQQPQVMTPQLQAQTPQLTPLQQPLSPLSPEVVVATANGGYTVAYTPTSGPYPGSPPNAMIMPLPLSVQMPVQALQQQQQTGYPMYMPVTAHPSPPQQYHGISAVNSVPNQPPLLTRPGSHPLLSGAAGGRMMLVGAGSPTSGGSNGLVSTISGGAGVPTGGFPFDPSAQRTIYVGGLSSSASLRALCDSIRGVMARLLADASPAAVNQKPGGLNVRRLAGVLERVHVVPARQCAFITFVSPIDAEHFFTAVMNSEAGFTVAGADSASSNKQLKIGWGQSQPLTMDVWDSVTRGGATRTLFIGQIAYSTEDPAPPVVDEKDAPTPPVEIEVINDLSSSPETEELLLSALPAAASVSAAASADGKTAPAASPVSGSDSKTSPAGATASAATVKTAYGNRALHRKLHTDLTVFGPIERITLVPSKSCAIVAFGSLQSSSRALQSLTRMVPNDGSASSSPQTDIYAKQWQVRFTKDRTCLPFYPASNTKSSK